MKMEKNYILLDRRIADKFHKKARMLSEYPLDYGAMTRLKIELMELCGLLELESLNVLCGRNVYYYINKYEGIVSGVVIKHEGYTGEEYVIYQINEEERDIFDRVIVV